MQFCCKNWEYFKDLKIIIIQSSQKKKENIDINYNFNPKLYLDECEPGIYLEG